MMKKEEPAPAKPAEAAKPPIAPLAAIAPLPTVLSWCDIW